MQYQKTIQVPTIGGIIGNIIPVKKKRIYLTKAQIESLRTVSEIALAIVATAGIVTLSAMAPNMLVAIDKLFLGKNRKRKLRPEEKKMKISHSIYYLRKSGLINMEPDGNDFKISLTDLGEEKAPKIQLAAQNIPKPKTWNGKWWQVAADIPTKEYRQAADMFRRKIRQVGFFPLQRTLWFYPYDPRAEIQHIAAYYGIGRYVTVMEINRLDKEDEDKLKEHFKKNGVL